MKGKIGIICASDTELAPYLTHIKDVDITERAMLKFYDGMINQSNSLKIKKEMK